MTSGTPSVQYAFDDAASSSNEIRLNQLTYPNDRTIAYELRHFRRHERLSESC